MSHRSSPSVDRISDLPLCLIQDILDRLSLKDAARTSILSTKWRNKWLCLTHLKFDDSFWSEKMSSNQSELLTIYQVLLQRTICNLPIQEITLSFPGLRKCPEIDFVIYYLSKINIQELTLCFSSFIDDDDNEDDEEDDDVNDDNNNDQRLPLPSHIFSCLQLGSLRLSYCCFIPPPPSFSGFTVLTHLFFQSVDFTGYNVYTFLPKCPVLKVLMIDKCENAENLVIDNASNLRSIYHEGDIESISFKRTKLLLELYVYPDKDFQIRDINGFFSDIPLLMLANMNSIFLKAVTANGVMERPLTTLFHLRFLRLYDVCFISWEEVSRALYLMRSSPNLTNLFIEVHDRSVDEEEFDLDFLGTHDFSNTTFVKLQDIRIRLFGGTQAEMEFLRIILARSPFLQRVEIQLAEMDIEEEVRSLKELSQLQRASPTAKLLFGNFGRV